MGDVLIPTAEHICSVPSVDFEKPLSYFRSRIEELRTSEVRLFHCMFAERLIYQYINLDSSLCTRMIEIHNRFLIFRWGGAFIIEECFIKRDGDSTSSAHLLLQK